MLTNMKRIGRDRPPVLNPAPGDPVVFETLDACSGEVRSIDDFANTDSPISGGKAIR